MDTNNQLAGKPEAVPNMPSRKTKQFRDLLLTRLPRLSPPSWDSRTVFDVHESMAGLRDLRADALLEPLAPLGDSRHG